MRLKFLHRGRDVLLVLAAAFLSACATKEPAAEVFTRHAEPFAFDALALTPIQATLAGYHEHVRVPAGESEGQEETATHRNLDELMDDYSAQGIQKRVQFYKDFIAKLHAEVERDDLARDEWADYAAIENKVALELFQYENRRIHEHNPVLYVELAGQALQGPLLLDYGAGEQRYRHIIARLNKFGEFFGQAKQNLQSAPEFWIQVARNGVNGLIDLVERDIPARTPESVAAEYEQAAEVGLAALRDFASFLQDDLSQNAGYDWRLGRAAYTERMRILGSSEPDIDGILQRVEEEFEQTRAQALEAALPVNRKIYGSNSRPASDVAFMRDVLEVMADENRQSRSDAVRELIEQDIEEAKAFVVDRELVPVPQSDNLRVVETPEFLRSRFPFAGILGVPPLEPQSNAYLFVTPLPAGLSRANQRSWFRARNNYTLKLVAMRLAVPGEYVQKQLSAEVPVPYRRVLRSVFSNPGYVLGWQVYATEMAVDSGFASADEMMLIWLLERLAVLADTIVDIRMHTMEMSDDEAMDLLRNRAFQEISDAQDTIARVKISGGDNAIRYLGWRDWMRVRDHYQNETTDFSLTSFHGKALRAGPLPANELGYLVSEGRTMSD